MEIDLKYIYPYWEKIVTQQLYDELKAKGYDVQIAPKLKENVRPDLIASNDSEKIMFEIVSKSKDKETIMKRREQAIKMGYKFKLVAAPLPHINPTLEFYDLEKLLLDWLQLYTPDDIDCLSMHSYVDEVSGVDLSSLVVDDDEIHAEGSCVVTANIEYDREDNIQFSMSFPATFRVLCNRNEGKWEISEVMELKIDTSSYYK